MRVKILKFGRRALLFASVVAVAVCSMFLLDKAVRADENPYAIARMEALRARESAFRSISLPAAVVKQFLLVTRSPGKRLLVSQGEEFESMVIHNVVYHNVVVSLDNAPMPAERWEVHWGERTFSTFLMYPQGDKPYWSFKIRTDKTAVACSSLEVEHIPINVIARATT